jgi:hypothetical protein
MQQDYFSQLLVEDLLSAPSKYSKNSKKTKKQNKTETNFIENNAKLKVEIISGGRYLEYIPFSFWNKLVNTIFGLFKH